MTFVFEHTLNVIIALSGDFFEILSTENGAADIKFEAFSSEESKMGRKL